MDKDQWEAVKRRLKEPFDPADIDWRPQGKENKDGKTCILAYVDARTVQDKLDEAVGAENWTFKWEPVAVVNGELKVAKGVLSIYGVPKEEVGDASNFEGNKGTISDALKRCAVMWGVGRYLYSLPKVWVRLEDGRIPEATLKTLQERLAKRQQAS